MNKRITTIEELEEYLKQKDLNNLFYSRQSIIPSLEAMFVILLGKYLQNRGIIDKIIGGTYAGDFFISGNPDKVAIVKGNGILIYQRNEEVKLSPFKYEFTNPHKWEKRKIEDIECENLNIRPYHPENLLSYVECKNRRVIDMWKEAVRNLSFLYPFNLFTDATNILKGKRASEYYSNEYPEFIENLHKAVLIENFDGGAEELEKAYNGKYVILAISVDEIKKFGNIEIRYRTLIVPSQGIKEIIEETLDKTIKNIPSNENNLIKIQRKLYEEFIKSLFNKS